MIDIDAIARQAFVAHGPASLVLSETGPLAGLTFAVKDLYDVAGYPTACGNPDRLRDTPPALATAPSVQVPLAHGARLVGKTHTDEVASGMFGMNPHYGTPINPAAPDRAPGGSSSGSASAVAAGLLDFALGSDTGGSIRVPASFCGIYGLRTTFGRISVAGVMAMAPSFDTVGWFARDPQTMRRVGESYFGAVRPAGPSRFLIARDAFAFAAPKVGETLLAAAKGLGPSEEITLYEEGTDGWLDTFRPLQLAEFFATLGGWANAPGRALSEAVRQRMDLAATVEATVVAAATLRREALTERLIRVLGDDGVLVIPTAHDLPPFREASVAEQTAFRDTTLTLTCVASLCRLPQLNVPAAIVDGCPVGLSLIAGPRGEERLLAVAEALGPLTAAS
ncbi:amidase [Amorphus sp. 3PC139-8]|uniref:amidase n=1 Tax=Amorphus sp. 3PC139-8 TaxID=2735676 RepID=UPI00345D2953